MGVPVPKREPLFLGRARPSSEHVCFETPRGVLVVLPASRFLRVWFRKTRVLAGVRPETRSGGRGARTVALKSSFLVCVPFQRANFRYLDYHCHKDLRGDRMRSGYNIDTVTPHTYLDLDPDCPCFLVEFSTYNYSTECFVRTRQFIDLTAFC